MSHRNLRALGDHHVVTIEEWHKEGTIHEKFCAKHDEQKRFYCETCEELVCRDCIVMKQHCRDHDYVTLKDVFHQKANKLREAMKECQEMCQRLKSALDDAQETESTLEKKFADAQTQIEMKKKTMLQIVSNSFDDQKRKVSLMQEQNVKEISEAKKEFHDSLLRAQSASDKANKLTTSGSDFEVVSQFTDTMKVLHDAKCMQINKVNTTFGSIDIPSIPYEVKVKRHWTLSKEFEFPHDYRSPYPSGIAQTRSGNFAVRFLDYVLILSESGAVTHKFSCYCGKGIVCTQDGKYMLPSGIRFCYPSMLGIHDDKCKKESSLAIKYENKHTRIICIGLDCHENILLGLGVDNYYSFAVSMYSRDGNILSQFQIPDQPYAITGTQNGQLATISNNECQLYDTSGRFIKQLPHPPLEDDSALWSPKQVCSTLRNELFVSDIEQGVHVYTGNGDYMSCIIPQANEQSWSNIQPFTLSKDGQQLLMVLSDEEGYSYRYKMRIYKRP